MKNTYITNAIFLVVGLVIGLLIWGAGFNQTSMGGHMMPNGSTRNQNIDEHFIAQMIPHHEGAIEMAEVVLERSTRSEVIALANGIIEAQQKEINDMTAWYKTWFGKAPEAAGMGMMHMDGMEGDISKLRSVEANEFDREFLNQMILHHEMAIMMAQMLQFSTSRPEMKGLADQIITSQSREINMMRSWLKSW